MTSWHAGYNVRLTTLSRARYHSTKESFSPRKLRIFHATNSPRADVTVNTEMAPLTFASFQNRTAFVRTYMEMTRGPYTTIRPYTT